MSLRSPIDTLAARLNLPGIATIQPGHSNLPKIAIQTEAAEAEIYLHGAHVTSWRPVGAEEVIFLSSQARYEDGKAIRGGIPVCFPWFRAKSDDPKAPQHGFVRTKAWQLQSLTHKNNLVAATLAMESDESTRKWWPHNFRIQHRITVGPTLKLELTVTNTGNQPFTFEEALHTYHKVGDVSQARITGLDGTAYLDNTDNNRERIQSGDITFSKLTDNAYLDTSAPVEILDPVLKRRICIEKENSESTVIWNPWQQGADSMSDMGKEEWRRMVCAEASNILNSAITLAPGERHTMAAIISVGQEA